MPRGAFLLGAHDPEKHVLDLIGDGDRFSEKIMRKQNIRLRKKKWPERQAPGHSLT